ncbi:uncharacterized, partial [Tachysurus ichikawai]
TQTDEPHARQLSLAGMARRQRALPDPDRCARQEEL